MTDQRPGPTLRADLHIHTLASDGISDVRTILIEAVRRRIDIIAITDHERIDAAVAARAIALDEGLPIEVIVGEEITTRNGHLLGLFLDERIRPWHSMRTSIARVHEQGGLAVVAHPLVPYPLCASARTIRRLAHDPDPTFHPDALEAFNPTTARMRWSHRVAALAEEVGVASVAGSDSHRASNVGRAVTVFRGTSAADLRVALADRDTAWEGTPYSWREQLRMFRRQMGKNAVAVRDDIGGAVRRDGTGRDLGYPGGRARPARFEPDEGGRSEQDASMDDETTGDVPWARP